LIITLAISSEVKWYIAKWMVFLALEMASDIICSQMIKVHYCAICGTDVRIYFSGQWKNKNKGQKRKEVKSKRGRGTSNQPVFGILWRYNNRKLSTEEKINKLLFLLVKKI